MRVKVCGVTRPEDAALAAELGASAVGMIFWPKSPRFVDRARAKEIVAALPPFVSAVGVFVNQLEEVAYLAHEVGLSAVQLHGDETPDSYRSLPYRAIKAIAVGDEETTRAAVAAVPASATILLDAYDPVKRGGTGRAVDWTVASEIARERCVILSGGLNAENVLEAAAIVRPYAIDVSSGVESAPGRKDPAKLRVFFAALRQL
jgi:phosphoribosylanthranilate isomerase